jgi:hypothetical protein
MDGNDKYSTYDLIGQAVDQKPIEFEGIFGELLIDRIERKINDIKLDMAKTIFNRPKEEQQEE